MVRRPYREKQTFLAVYCASNKVLIPLERGKRLWGVLDKDVSRYNLCDNQLVRAAIVRKSGMRICSIVSVIDATNLPDGSTLQTRLGIEQYGFSSVFSDDTLEQIHALTPWEADTIPSNDEGIRVDLRHLPFVTIDPSDAKDHDDALYVEKDTDKNNNQGWIAWIAIADVSYYVSLGTPLDREAQSRANSVYLPSFCLPMLPERLSSDLCSLKAHVDRPAIVCRIVFDADGKKKGCSFCKASIRSCASLEYAEVQKAMELKESTIPNTLVHEVLEPLFNLYRMAQLHQAESLDVRMPEKKIIFDCNNEMCAIASVEQLESHKVVEYFMIQANVCAGQYLELHDYPVIYRVHPPPERSKVLNFMNFVQRVGFSVSGLKQVSDWNRVLRRTEDTEYSNIVKIAVLQSQSTACYCYDNQGHYGLSLPVYTHFTSPIRRYADLMVHRGIVSVLESKGALLECKTDLLADGLGTARHISDMERQAMKAERHTMDRYIAKYFSRHIGEVFSGYISGVLRFGIFISTYSDGISGFVPVSELGEERYYYNAAHQTLRGMSSGMIFSVGQNVEAELVSSCAISGSLNFKLTKVDGKEWKGRGRSRKRVKKHRRTRKLKHE
jgi:ribonuclease R